jgi:hypothetical protein
LLERWDSDPPFERRGDLQDRLDRVPAHLRGDWWHDAYKLRWMSDLSAEQRRALFSAERGRPR